MDEIRNYMEETLISIDREQSLSDGLKVLQSNSVSSLLITDNGKYAGIFTETDLARHVIAEGRKLSKIPMSVFLNKRLITLEASHSMQEAYERMRSSHIRHLGVTDGGEFVGLLSIKDFANYYHNAFNADDSERGDIDYFMQKTLAIVSPEQSVRAVAKTMKELKTGAVLIGNREVCTGLATERHLLQHVCKALEAGYDSQIGSIKVQPFVSIPCKESMESAYQLMRKHNIRHLAVTDKPSIANRKIVGVLATNDFASYYSFKVAQDVAEEDKVRYYMEENLLEIDSEATVQAASQLMREHNAGALLVKRGDKYSGLVTERDLIHGVLAEGGKASDTISAHQAKPVTIDTNRSMEDVLSAMRDNNVRYVIATENKRIKGIVSIKDLAIYFKHKYVSESVEND
ncbi:MAG: CBS domain-containing protein [Candidatus Nitrohelix vancouverensis]|uniref:CBS domain-containing protein n=1 Tax=Candidatus Nitrohelix vancouverensis TaxID=2705534 RepID=A0A7T0C174_9BACT|nr:MAG: CBS domain-containing protein [Candidatus Nitrohelix vancouverensis]